GAVVECEVFKGFDSFPDCPGCRRGFLLGWGRLRALAFGRERSEPALPLLSRDQRLRARVRRHQVALRDLVTDVLERHVDGLREVRQRVSQLVEDQRRLLGLALGHAATPSRSTDGLTCRKPPTLLSASTVSSSGRRVRSAAGMPVASETL